MKHSFRINGRHVEVLDRDRIGSGGQADVFGRGDEAFKVMRGLSPAAARLLDDKLGAFPSNLPAAVVSPRGILRASDGSGRAVGYVMRRVKSAFVWHRLSRRPWRAGRLSMNEVLAYFSELHEVIAQSHRCGVIIGDLNDANILFSNGSQDGCRVHLIDADSMQFGRFPCPVGHPRYVPPELYGVNFAAAPAFTEQTDWYAYAVLLFQAVMYMHPYGGVHPHVSGINRRAEARLSALRDDVARPKVASEPGSLPAALARYFNDVFDEGHRRVPSISMLAAPWNLCVSCAREYATPTCLACEPSTASSVVVPNGARIVRNQNVFGRVIAQCPAGGIVAASTSHGRLRYLLFDGTGLFREDGRLVAQGPIKPGISVALEPTRTWLGMGSRLIGISHATGRSAEPAVTQSGVFLQETTMAVVDSSAVRLDGDRIVDHDEGTTLGQALDGRTWLAGGADHGIALQDLGNGLMASVFSPTCPGLRALTIPRSVAAATPDGVRPTLRHVDGHTAGGFALMDLHMSVAGDVRRHLLVFAVSGALVLHKQLSANVAGGACLAGNQLMWPTDTGIQVVSLTAPAHAPTTLAATAPFVCAADALLPGPNGALYVVSPHAIVLLRLGGA